MEFYWQKKSNLSVDGPVRLQTWLFSNKYIYIKAKKIKNLKKSKHDENFGNGF